MPILMAQGSGEARNVSASGIYFVTDAALQVGSAVELSLEFRDYPGGALRVTCAAKVVRVEPRDGRLGVGAAISSLQFARAGGPQQ